MESPNRKFCISTTIFFIEPFLLFLHDISDESTSSYFPISLYQEKKALSVLKSGDKSRFNCKQIVNTWPFSLQTTAKPPGFLSAGRLCANTYQCMYRIVCCIYIRSSCVLPASSRVPPCVCRRLRSSDGCGLYNLFFPAFG